MSNHSLQRYRLAALLSLGILVGGLTGQSLSAPAPNDVALAFG